MYVLIILDTFNEDNQDICFRAFKPSNSDNKESKLNEAVHMSMSYKVDPLKYITNIFICILEIWNLKNSLYQFEIFSDNLLIQYRYCSTFTLF